MNDFINCRLPRGLIEKIDETFRNDPTRRNAAVKAVQRIYNKYLKRSAPFCEFIPISRDYKRELIGSQYHKVFTALQDAGVIETFKFSGRAGQLVEYRPPKRDKRTGEKLEDGICKHYRFSQNLVYSIPELTKYQEKETRRFDRSFVVQKTVPILQALELSFKSEDEIKDFLLDYLVEQDAPAEIRKAVKVNDQITAERIRINGTTQKRNTAEVLEMYAGTNYTLVEYNFNKRIRYYLIENFDLDTFVDQRLEDVYFRTYYRQLEKILYNGNRKNINCSRNKTNDRLDHNLTNFKSKFLKYITLDGDPLVGLDLKNSQFCIFANTLEYALYFSNNVLTNLPQSNTQLQNLEEIQNLPKQLLKSIIKYLSTPYNPKLCLNTKEWHCKSDSYGDLRIFLSAAKSGRFYEMIAKHLFGLEWSDQVTEEQRKEAKKLMFLVFFDSYTHEHPEKEILRKHFPTLVGLVDGYKQFMYYTVYLPAFKKNKAKFRDRYGKDATPSKIASNCFSILLQSIESKIFIDRILVKLLNLGLQVLSKHDSILCKAKDLPAVETVLCNELDDVFGPGNYMISKE